MSLRHFAAAVGSLLMFTLSVLFWLKPGLEAMASVHAPQVQVLGCIVTALPAAVWLGFTLFFIVRR